MTRQHMLILGGAGAVALVLLAAGSKASPGGSIKVPAAQTESAPPFLPPPELPVLGPDQHPGGFVYTPHRYPAACGNDITVAIHRGFATMALPAEADMTWLSASPAEGDL